jgi:hypothetical protein
MNFMNEGEMKRDTQQTRRLHIFSDPDDPDVFLVVMDACEPDAMPVIPTAMAESYWVHPSWTAVSAATR